ncbi:probable glutathione S-transferase GSTU6 [Triticum urartu]|nr:probable glutathione S-transferase GSTU6 [Triticum urartu]
MAGGEGDVKLLGLRLSPFVARVRMALDTKGVRYEYVEEDLAAKSSLLLASNPVHRKVPVLIHAGRPVCESLVILHYVDEAWPGARERAAARFWAAYVDGELFPAWGRVMMAATEEERAERAGEAAGMVARLEEAFAGCSDGGDAVGYLDLVLGSNLFWFEAPRRLLGVRLIDKGRTPLLAAWAVRFGEAAAANGMVTDALVDMAVEHAKKLRAAAMAAGK